MARRPKRKISFDSIDVYQDKEFILRVWWAKHHSFTAVPLRTLLTGAENTQDKRLRSRMENEIIQRCQTMTNVNDWHLVLRRVHTLRPWVVANIVRACRLPMLSASRRSLILCCLPTSSTLFRTALKEAQTEGEYSICIWTVARLPVRSRLSNRLIQYLAHQPLDFPQLEHLARQYKHRSEVPVWVKSKMLAQAVTYTDWMDVVGLTMAHKPTVAIKAAETAATPQELREIARRSSCTGKLLKHVLARMGQVEAEPAEWLCLLEGVAPAVQNLAWGKLKSNNSQDPLNWLSLVESAEEYDCRPRLKRLAQRKLVNIL